MKQESYKIQHHQHSTTERGYLLLFGTFWQYCTKQWVILWVVSQNPFLGQKKRLLVLANKAVAMWKHDKAGHSWASFAMLPAVTMMYAAVVQDKSMQMHVLSVQQLEIASWQISSW